MVSFLNRFRKSKVKEEAVDKSSEGAPGIEAAVALELTRIAGDLYKVLDANSMRKSAFHVKDAPYIIDDAVSREYIVQVYSTEDPWLGDVLVDGASTSTKDAENQAWVALTTLQVATGKISKIWKEQFASKKIKYAEISSVGVSDNGVLTIESPAGKIEVAFAPDTDQEVLIALKGFMEGRGKQST